MATRHGERPWFKSPDELLTALTLWIPEPDPLPSELLQHDDLGWTPEQNKLQPLSRFQELLAQFDFDVHLAPVPEGVVRIRTTALLASVSWDYCDPVGTTALRGGLQQLPLDGEWAFLDRGERHLQFLLAARDRDGAKRILDAMSAFQADGVQAAPLARESIAGAGCPYGFFWQLTLDRPHPLVFSAADRVWWGPVGHGRVGVFFEYPYRPRLTDELRRRLPHRMQWSQENGTVLFGPHAPRLLELSRAPDGRRFGTYLGMVELSADPAAVCQPVVARQEPTRSKFRVEIRLGRRAPEAEARLRIDSLRREIAGKARLLDRLTGPVARSEPNDDRVPEPLFLYPHRTSGSDLPEPLRRLLIEWSDQPETLGSLAYAILQGSDLPSHLFSRETCSRVHVLTTFGALGCSSGCVDTAAALLDYAPWTAGSWPLNLSRVWAAQGLRLFTPAGRHVSLYPNLRPTPLSAERVAAAILDRLARAPKNPLYLLLPGMGPLPQFLVLDADDFQPFRDAFNWVLDLDFQAVVAPYVQPLQQRLLPALTAAIDNDITTAAQREAKSRVGPAVEGLREDVAALQEQIDGRKQRLREAQREAQELDRISQDAEQRLFDEVRMPIASRVQQATITLLKEVEVLEKELELRQKRVEKARLRANELDHLLDDSLVEIEQLTKDFRDTSGRLQTILTAFQGADLQATLDHMEQIITGFRILLRRWQNVQSRLSEMQRPSRAP